MGKFQKAKYLKIIAMIRSAYPEDKADKVEKGASDISHLDKVMSQYEEHDRRMNAVLVEKNVAMASG